MKMSCRIRMFGLVLTTMFLLIQPGAAFELEGYDDIMFPSETKTISMDFTNARLNNVLKVFSQQSGLNFIAATNVADKTVNLYLDNVPVEEALERILAANNLTYEIKQDSNIFLVNEVQVSPVQLMTRVYPLKFATVPSSKLHNTLSSSDEDNESASGQETEIKDGLIAALEAILSDNGSVVEDTRTNSLVVSDIPSQFPMIEQTITRLDIRIPQILIEAELLDISKNTADLLGAKFGNTPITFTGAERSILYPYDRNKAFSNAGKSGGQGFTFEGTTNENEFTTGTLSFAGLSATLQFLRTKTDTRNLARPRILTLNNGTAEISIKTDEAIGIQSITTSAEGTAETTAEAERVETGVFLKVTPQANIQTREITMAVEPKVIQARTGATFSGQSFKDPEERGSKSILRINDGDTIVLGGLLRTDVEDIRTTVPVIGDIPILGMPFRHKDKEETQRELIIFITPHIIEELSPPQGAPAQRQKIVREQKVSANRSEAIEKELSFIEQGL